MDWARLLYVGDILFNLKKVEVSAHDEEVPDEVKKKGLDVPCIEVEYRVREEVIINYYYFDTKDERDAHFELIDEEELRAMLLKELDLDL